MFYGWARPDEGLDFPAPGIPAMALQVPTTTRITATMVTIVDTILNVTTVSTSLPPGWTPPPTNAAGTQTYLIPLANSTVTLLVATHLLYCV